MNKDDAERRKEEEHQKLVSRMVAGAEGRVRITAQKSRSQHLELEECKCWKRWIEMPSF